MTDERRILLVRLDGLGDALVCVPALAGLRRAFAGARFGAVCSRANAELFSPSRVDRIHVHDRGVAEDGFIAELRSARYTDALVATEEPVGYRLARASGARRRTGFWHRFEKTFKSIWQYAQLTDAVYRPAAWVDAPEHEVSAIYRLAERIGARRPIPDDPNDLRAWLRVAGESAPSVGADAFALQIAPKLCSNGWAPAAIALLAHAAIASSPFRRCVLLAAPSDQGLARSIMEQWPPGATERARVELAPPTDLSRWLGAIATAGALVTPDTGAAHAAGMLGVPVVDLFETDRFDRLSRQWRPWAAASRCLPKPAYARGAESEFGARIAAALSEIARTPGLAP